MYSHPAQVRNGKLGMQDAAAHCKERLALRKAGAASRLGYGFASPQIASLARQLPLVFLFRLVSLMRLACVCAARGSGCMCS